MVCKKVIALSPLVNINDLSKQYAPNAPWVLQNQSFDLDLGESVAIMGASGRGKSTFLHILGLLDDIYDGQYLLNGVDVACLKPKQKTILRNQIFGFVFQAPYLIPHLNVFHNIALPLVYRKMSQSAIHERVMTLLEKFELSDLASQLPCTLSGGQMQRISILRAMAQEPQCILADEPTASLDHKTQTQVLQQLFHYQAQFQCSLVIITHHQEVAYHCHRLVKL